MRHNNLPSKLLDRLSTQQTLNFEYSILEAETRRVVQRRTNEIKTIMRRNSQDIIDIGQKLIEVKQHLGHGSFMNWLKSEFNWSISAATKFMQVAEQFKFINFTNLNITASALYLIAAPSTPKQARVEVLERASLGENIGYTKAKAIVCENRKTKKGVVESKIASLKSDEPVYVIEPTHYETKSAISAQEDLIGKDVLTKTRSLLSPESLVSVAFEDKQIAPTFKNLPDNTTHTPASSQNRFAILQETSDVESSEMVISSIQNLTPEQLAKVIIKAAKKGLSEYQLLAIITVSQKALHTQQEFGVRYKEVS